MDFFKPPSPLTDYDIKNWQLWKQKFDIYLKASGKKNEIEEVKIAILLNCIGDEGLEVYNTFEDDKKSTLQKLLDSYDAYFLPKKVIPMETFKFNNLVQGKDQSIEQYVTELKKQAKSCEFVFTKPECITSYEERMIRDRLIVGVYDKQIQARLLRETELDLKKIVEYCKSVNLSKEHLKTLNFEFKEEQVNVVKAMEKIKCPRCLYEHVKNKCPAFYKTCACCQKRGHFAKACTNNKEEKEDPHNIVKNTIGAQKNNRKQGRKESKENQ